jgi:hypothetical protein
MAAPGPVTAWSGPTGPYPTDIPLFTITMADYRQPFSHKLRFDVSYISPTPHQPAAIMHDAHGVTYNEYYEIVDRFTKLQVRLNFRNGPGTSFKFRGRDWNMSMSSSLTLEEMAIAEDTSPMVRTTYQYDMFLRHRVRAATRITRKATTTARDRARLVSILCCIERCLPALPAEMAMHTLAYLSLADLK